MEKALKIAVAIPQNRLNEYRIIGKGYGSLGNAKNVLDFAGFIPIQEPSNVKETVLQESALAAANAGYISQADEIAETIKKDNLKTLVMASIRRAASIQKAKTGDFAGAIKAAEELPTAEERVFTLVEKDVPNLASEDHYWDEGIAHFQFLAGEKTGARETALKALHKLAEVNQNRKGLAALAVVRILARMDDLPAARKALAQVSPIVLNEANFQKKQMTKGRELKAKGYIAAAEVRAGRDDAALVLARDFEEPGEQAYIFHFVALVQARAGKKDAAKVNFNRAIELVTEDAKGSGTTLHNIATAQALAGDFVGAAKTAEKIDILNRRATLFNIIYAQAKNGDFAGARKEADGHLKGFNVTNHASKLPFYRLPPKPKPARSRQSARGPVRRTINSLKPISWWAWRKDFTGRGARCRGGEGMNQN